MRRSKTLTMKTLLSTRILTTALVASVVAGANAAQSDFPFQVVAPKGWTFSKDGSNGVLKHASGATVTIAYKTWDVSNWLWASAKGEVAPNAVRVTEHPLTGSVIAEFFGTTGKFSLSTSWYQLTDRTPGHYVRFTGTNVTPQLAFEAMSALKR